MILPDLKAILIGMAYFAVSAIPMNADASLISDISFDQHDGQSSATFFLQNNDCGVTYESGLLKWHEMLVEVADFIIAENYNYFDKTRAEVMSEWTFRIAKPPVGDIHNGWNGVLNDGELELDHKNKGYSSWLNSTPQHARSELAIIANFFDQLDVNHNGVYDSGFEQLTWSGGLVDDAFTGYDACGEEYSSDANAVTVIPEPAVISLIGFTGIGFLAYRRLASKK